MIDHEAIATHFMDYVESFFDDSSLCTTHQPTIVILMGGPAGGKTTIRKQRYSHGYVIVDAADIFLRLCDGEYVAFPDELLDIPLNIIGGIVACRAIEQRRNIVTEIIGADYAATQKLIESMRSVGYHVDVQLITCDIAVAAERNFSRGDDCISAYYAEAYQQRWLVNAAYVILHPEDTDA